MKRGLSLTSEYLVIFLTLLVIAVALYMIVGRILGG